MKEKDNTLKQQNYFCEICKKEIPPSVEFHPEGNEYVRHFCGLDCYLKWHEEHMSQSNQKK